MDRISNQCCTQWNTVANRRRLSVLSETGGKPFAAAVAEEIQFLLEELVDMAQASLKSEESCSPFFRELVEIQALGNQARVMSQELAKHLAGAGKSEAHRSNAGSENSARGSVRRWEMKTR